MAAQQCESTRVPLVNNATKIELPRHEYKPVVDCLSLSKAKKPFYGSEQTVPDPVEHPSTILGSSVSRVEAHRTVACVRTSEIQGFQPASSHILAQNQPRLRGQRPPPGG